MSESSVVMPDGSLFEFWDDGTKYRKIYHVARENPSASDDNPGTKEKPFKTISKAASILLPREKVIVHQGVYREWVRPAHGGEGPERMIAYEAAQGETVRVLGSKLWQPEFKPTEGWSLGGNWTGRIWMADLPAEWFIGYNPFAVTNMSAEYTVFTFPRWSAEETRRMQLKRGMIFADGQPLKQVFRITDLTRFDGAFWVEDPGLRIHLRLFNDADPRSVQFEVVTREQVFAPEVRGLGYIRVSGFSFEHAANGVPIPQRGMISTSRGHHWIIENNTIRWANALGLDVGNESWHASRRSSEKSLGGHIVRRNYVSDCGVCGIAGCGSVDHTLVEKNVIERIGGMNIERIWESAGLKFHRSNGVLIRRNVFRHVYHAPGLWLDYLNRNSRVTRNVFVDIESIHGACFIEVSHEANAVDHNIFWDIRPPTIPTAHPRMGSGVNVDTGEKCLVAHNLFGKIQGYAVNVHLMQAKRVVGGRVGLCRKHKVMNNIFVECPHRIFFSRSQDNESDGNLFDVRTDLTPWLHAAAVPGIEAQALPISFCIEHPEPEALLDLEAWQEYYGFDKNSAQAVIHAELDPETLVLTISVEGKLPKCSRITGISKEKGKLSPGPFDLKPGKQVYRLK